MYQAHFGLTQKPFGLTPNTAFYCDHPSHRQALNTLLLALRTGEGFIKLTGEIGLGKTMLCRQLLRSLENEQPAFAIAYLPDPLLDAAGLRRAVAREFGLSVPHGENSHDLMQRLQHHLIELHQREQRPVIIVDEAQGLPETAMEALRLLTNLETEQEKLLQVVLIGQPELDQRLNSISLRQLRQRIAFSCQLQPLTVEQVREYIDHRLAVAGHSQPGLFGKAATRLIHRASGGVPRLVNLLAHKAMINAYGLGDHVIGRRHVRAALADHDQTAPHSPSRAWRSAAAAVVLATASALWWLGGQT